MLTKYFLSIILWGVIVVSTNAQMSFSEFYIESIERAEAYTLELVSIMPEEKMAFKPVEEVNTFHNQVTHVIKNIGFLQTYITGNRDSPIRDMDLSNCSKPELLKYLKDAFKHLKEIASDISDEEAVETTQFFREDVRMDKRGILLLIKNHLTLHQGQLVVYLRLNGFSPPKFNGY